MANLPEDKQWTGVYQWETSDRALGGPDSLFTKPTRDLTARTGYLKEQIEKGNYALTAHEKSTNHPDATTTAKGFVKLSSAVDSTSETLAATPKAVKTAMDKANSAASAASTAQTTANTANSTANTAQTNAATAQSKADSAYSLANKANSTASSAKSTAETDATTSAKGRVQLNSAVNSTAENQAATPKAVKTAYDLASLVKNTLPQKIVLYPNGGSETNPTIIKSGDIFTIDNPFLSMDIVIIPEVLVDNKWGQVGFVYISDVNGSGISAKCINQNKISIVGGLTAIVNTNSSSDGNPFNKKNSGHIKEAKYRLRLIKF